MNFTLNDDQKAFIETAKSFSDKELKPFAGEWDEKSYFPVDTIKKAAEMGFATLYCREEHGGLGLGRLESALIFETLSAGCVSTAAYLSIHNMVSWVIDTFGSDSQRFYWLPQLTEMSVLASYCLTESNSGSDAASLKTKAVKSGDHYILDGSKCFISGAGVSDVYLVMARTSDDGANGISAFIVEKEFEGVSFGALEKKMGWKSQPTAVVNFDSVKVPATHLIGREGQGFKFAMQALDGGRVNIASCSLGGAARALEQTLSYMAERKQFGKSLDSFQALQFRLADMRTELEAAKLMVYKAAHMLDINDPEKTFYCAMAKRFTTDICSKIANEALQLHGGYGYIHDYEVERLVRDLRVHQILEGTNEIMRVIVSKKMLA